MRRGRPGVLRCVVAYLQDVSALKEGIADNEDAQDMEMTEVGVPLTPLAGFR